MELFAILGKGYEVAALESPCRARDLYPLYKPHVIIVYLRYPKDIVILEECLALAGRVPVVATISLLAKQTFVKTVKEKAAALVVLPVKPQPLDKLYGAWRCLRMKHNLRRMGKRFWELIPQKKNDPTQQILFRSR